MSTVIISELQLGHRQSWPKRIRMIWLGRSNVKLKRLLKLRLKKKLLGLTLKSSLIRHEKSRFAGRWKRGGSDRRGVRPISRTTEAMLIWSTTSRRSEPGMKTGKNKNGKIIWIFWVARLPIRVLKMLKRMKIMARLEPCATIRIVAGFLRGRSR